MLSEVEKLKLFEGLCDELRSKSFDHSYSYESELKEHVVEVVRNYMKPYQGEVGVYEDKYLIEKVNAFGREQCPDISIEVGGQTFAAIELKLLRHYWGMARGIGQSIIDSARYKYVTIFAIDKREFEAQKHEFDEEIESSLWDNYRIRLIIRA